MTDSSNQDIYSSLNSICFVRLSALGDVLMFVPLIRAIQHYCPHAKLTWIICRPAYDLVEGLDGVEFIVIDKPKGLRDYWRFRHLMAERQFDVLIAAQACYRANFLYPWIHAGIKLGYDRLRAKDFHWLFVDKAISPGKDHTLDGFLKFALALGMPPVRPSWNIPIDESHYQWVRERLPVNDRRILLINPASSKPERSWLVERYVAVIKEAQTRWHLNVILTGGPTPHDREMADAILAQVDCFDWVGKTKPKQLLALIALADLLICPDTGPSHMAAAVGTPVIALHAVTSAEVSGPYTYRELAVDCYPEAVKQILKKTDETNIWGTHAHGEETMSLITIEAVLAKMAMFFSV